MTNVDNTNEPQASDDEGELLKLLGNAGEGQRLVEALINSDRMFISRVAEDAKKATSLAQNARNYLRSDDGAPYRDTVDVVKNDRTVTLVNRSKATDTVKQALDARKRGAA